MIFSTNKNDFSKNLFFFFWRKKISFLTSLPDFNQLSYIPLSLWSQVLMSGPLSSAACLHYTLNTQLISYFPKPRSVPSFLFLAIQSFKELEKQLLFDLQYCQYLNSLSLTVSNSARFKVFTHSPLPPSHPIPLKLRHNLSIKCNAPFLKLTRCVQGSINAD